MAPGSAGGCCAALRYASTTSSTKTKSRAVVALTSGGNPPLSPWTISDGSKRRGSSYGPYTLYRRSVQTLAPCTVAAETHIAVAAALAIPYGVSGFPSSVSDGG